MVVSIINQAVVFTFLGNSQQWTKRIAGNTKKLNADYSLSFTVPKKRNDIGYLLEELNFTHGVEVGVQRGRFSAIHVLPHWKSCQSYKLVDLWANQENYVDSANVADNMQEQIFRGAKARLAKFGNITEFFRMSSLEAAKLIENVSLDFVYVDARHDYCGVKEDILLYWPKLRPGGIMAGHDFVYAADVVGDKTGDWSICADGSIHPEAVRGAVEEFANDNGLTISTTNEMHASWMFRKPWGNNQVYNNFPGNIMKNVSN